MICSFFIISLILFIQVHIVCGDEVKITVEQGILSGEKVDLVTKDGSYYSFKGIPYAAPPVGALRFKDPQAPLAWVGVKNASQHGAVCPQVDIFTNQYKSGDENCVFLNVYSPDITTDSLPVMFFIHGGGYTSSSGDDDEFGPDFLVAKGVIVVTTNYRLGVLGFLSMDTKDVPGNAGLKDQLMAMKWVKKNIAKFGGDPDNVTIFGQSTGGGSVGFHVISPLSKGYFKRAILMSGSPLNDWSIPFVPPKRANVLGKQLSNYSLNDADIFSFLQSTPYENLVKAKPIILSSEEIIVNLIKKYFFTPVNEINVGQDIFLPQEPAALLKSGEVNEVDIMFGYTNGEGLLAIPAFEASLLALYNKYPDLLVPLKMLNEAGADINLAIADKVREYYFGNRNINVTTIKEMVHYVSNATFAYGIQRFFRLMPNPGNNSRYFYKFSCESKRNAYSAASAAKYGLHGAGHKDDLLYLFNAKSLNMSLEKNTTEYALVDMVTTLYTNFAKFGNPTPDSSLGVTWPQFNNESLEYLDIGNKLTVSNSPDEEDIKFWKSIYDFAGFEFW